VSSVYVLLVLVPLCVVVYVLWAYRRKAQQRDAANAERLHDVIGLAARAARGQGNATPEHASGGLQDSDSHALVSYIKRDRLLTAPQTLLYYMLKNELPDNLVFAEMPLSSVLETAPGVAEHARAEMARRLRDHRVDFVIADKRMHPLAVLKLTAHTEGQRHEVSSTQRWLAEAGIRYVEIDARALPRKEDIRMVVFGDDAAHRQHSEAAQGPGSSANRVVG